jgi:hypothetical protein
MIYTYHFHATSHPTPGTVNHADGIFRTDYPITGFDDYRMIKESIANDETTVMADPGEITIRSLSLIATTEGELPESR